MCAHFALADALDASAHAVVRIADRQLEVDLTGSPGALRPWADPEAAGGGGGSVGGDGADNGHADLRPPWLELQRVAVADTAPNLAQVLVCQGFRV